MVSLLSCHGLLAHPRTRCQAQGVMQGALSTSTQAACSGPTNGRRESGCLPGQCKTDRMAALARTRLQVLVVVASPKLTRACASRSDSRLLGNAGGSPTLSSSSFETPESLHVGVVKNQPPESCIRLRKVSVGTHVVVCEEYWNSVLGSVK